MKHTPGPWKVKENGKHETPSVWSVNEFGMRREICRVKDAACNGEYKYNAALIAAAPELLDALERLFEHTAMIHNQWGEDDNTKEADAAIRDARAAIAKAQGSQPS